ncbi:unnamed protein product [Didymodactylos carnosus]|uniref:Uncharacterized protein n=1 Tax=Didymodactylos carnosus TaxID=1234261 RepID=A0A815FDT9_9BILA|nr:unnamed protein product [Didymodactylos carnosus]CAF1324080.1 unnamed protein product [Didymodactylos carnosus]CAF3653477.1 unnamed protein product [Didymodactylos carnosus]CAF4172312.1 unnamed protein product [Didymodactylos carnosus]
MEWYMILAIIIIIPLIIVLIILIVCSFIGKRCKITFVKRTTKSTITVKPSESLKQGRCLFHKTKQPPPPPPPLEKKKTFELCIGINKEDNNSNIQEQEKPLLSKKELEKQQKLQEKEEKEQQKLEKQIQQENEERLADKQKLMEERQRIRDQLRIKYNLPSTPEKV